MSRLKKGKWVSITHNHPVGEYTEDGKEIIRIIDSFITKAI